MKWKHQKITFNSQFWEYSHDSTPNSCPCSCSQVICQDHGEQTLPSSLSSTNGSASPRLITYGSSSPLFQYTHPIVVSSSPLLTLSPPQLSITKLLQLSEFLRLDSSYLIGCESNYLFLPQSSGFPTQIPRIYRIIHLFLNQPLANSPG